MPLTSSCLTHRRVAGALATLMIAGASWHSHADEVLTLREVVFEQPGDYWWERPRDVRFVRLLACGGGGGGGGGFSFGRDIPTTRQGGGGGAGAQVHDVLIGPLTAARYQVTVGNAGKGGASRLLGFRTSPVRRHHLPA